MVCPIPQGDHNYQSQFMNDRLVASNAITFFETQ